MGEIRETMEQGAEGRADQMAEKLAREAMGQWWIALRGMSALPTATVLSVASTAMYMTAFAERWFELFETSIWRVREETKRERHEAPRAVASPDGGEKSKQPRA